MTEQLYGITSTSMQSVHTLMRQEFGSKRVMVLSQSLQERMTAKYQRRARRARLFLAGSISEMMANMAILNKRRNPIVVFDNAVLLNKFGAKILDMASPTETIIQFQPARVDLSVLRRAVAKRREFPRHNLVRQRVELLPTIIADHTITGCMDKFNTFMYAITTKDNRPQLRPLIVRYVFGKLSVAEFNQQLLNRGIKLTTSKIRPLYDALVNYLESDKGQTLRAALKRALEMETDADKTAAADGKRRIIKYKDLSHTFGVDSFELRNLILLWRDTH